MLQPTGPPVSRHSLAGWARAGSLPLCLTHVGPQGPHFTGPRGPERGPGTRRTSPLLQQPWHHFLSCLHPAMHFQNPCSWVQTPLRCVPGPWACPLRTGRELLARPSLVVFVSQVYSPYVPPALAPPANLPPYVPASQPTVQLVLQGSLPLAGCGLGQSLAAVPTALATTTDTGSQATNSEERMATPKPGLEKTKKEEVRPGCLPGWADASLRAPE